MAFVLGAATAAWLAGLGCGTALLLPAASVARLLPRRHARVEALVWLIVPLGQLAGAMATVVAAVWWAGRPLEYTPHLERPLAHVCFLGAARSLLGAEFMRAGSVAVVVLVAAAAVRVATRAVASWKARDRALADARPLANPFFDRVYVSPHSPAAATVGLLCPVVVVGGQEELGLEAMGAILAHETDHARWRDPLVAVALEAVAWVWPLPGALVLRLWRRAGEAAADQSARRRAGDEAWAAAVEAYGPRQWGDDAHRPETPTPAMAAAAAWTILLVACGRLVWQPAVMSVVCAFEAFSAAWR